MSRHARILSDTHIYTYIHTHVTHARTQAREYTHISGVLRRQKQKVLLDRLTDRLTDRQTDRQTYRYTNIFMFDHKCT